MNDIYDGPSAAEYDPNERDYDPTNDPENEEGLADFHRERQLAYWESEPFIVGHNGEQPHED